MRRTQIGSLFAEGRITEVRRRLADLHSADIADLLDKLDEADEKLRLYALLEPDVASDVIRDVGDTSRDIILEHLSDDRLAEVVERLDTDDATDLIGGLPHERRGTVLDQASPETRREVEDLLAYPPDTAGGIMKKEVAAVTVGSTVAEVIAQIRARADIYHDIHNVFVIDFRGHLVGVIPLRRLILADTGIPVEQVMDTDMISIPVDLDQEHAAQRFEKYDLLSVPVVDPIGRLVGRITIDDIVDVIAEEATEDILALGGLGLEAARPMTAMSAIRVRLPWLGLNLLTATAGAATVALFEETIATLAIAAAFMNIVAIQGGNAGVQTMTLIVRGLALGEIEGKDAGRLLGRELLTALANGAVLGLVSAAMAYAWTGNAQLSVVLGIALLVNLLIAAVLGSLVPIGLKKVGVDPAVSSNVFVTAGTDILGFFVFLGMLALLI